MVVIIKKKEKVEMLERMERLDRVYSIMIFFGLAISEIFIIVALLSGDTNAILAQGFIWILVFLTILVMNVRGVMFAYYYRH